MRTNRPDNLPPKSLLDSARDWLYDRVYQEGDFALQFVADFIHGHEPKRHNAHLHRQMNYSASKNKHSEKPLNAKEQALFMKLLQRMNGEDQVSYWKRQKSLLHAPNKRALVQEFISLQKDTDNFDQAEIMSSYQKISAKAVNQKTKQFRKR